MTLYAHGVDLLRHPDADLMSNRLWPAYQHRTDETEDPAPMAVITPNRFDQWREDEPLEAWLFYEWARDLMNADVLHGDDPVAAWPGRNPAPGEWRIRLVTWDEGRLSIDIHRPRLRPTLANPVQTFSRTWTADLEIRPPFWPWNTPCRRFTSADPQRSVEHRSA